MAVRVFTATLPFEPRQIKTDEWVQKCMAEVRESGERVVDFSLSPPYDSLVSRTGRPGPVISGPIYIDPVAFTLTIETED